MRDFFASLYEWFGLSPFYSTDLGEHLRGYDITCSDYTGTPWYVYIGWIMIGLTIFFYILQYYIINSPGFNKRVHWWLTALVIILLNFFIAFILPWNEWQAGDFCKQLRITLADCLGFAASNAIWSFILFLLITSFNIPRRWAGHNTTDTTFWKPKS
ncbi:MAG TPA: hypothetical protein VGC76_19470 [Pyrinomonadaceae bacterium]|jgi:hypothetical protein